MPQSTKGQTQERVTDAILYLGTKKSWRFTDLEDWIGNEPMLRRLDRLGYILVREMHLRSWPVDEPFGWYSPRRRPGQSWERLIARGAGDPEYTFHMKLSDHGWDTFEDLQEQGGHGGDAVPAGPGSAVAPSDPALPVGEAATHTTTTAMSAEAATPGSTIDFPNPSQPMSKKNAADGWGGDMTEKKLTALMASGKVRYKELNRETFIFCLDDMPNFGRR